MTALLHEVLTGSELAYRIEKARESQSPDEGLRARIIRVNGTSETVYLKPDDRPEQINQHIGANAFDCVEVVKRADGRPGLDAWVDDDGLFTKQPNVVASAILRWFTEQPHQIHGDVLFSGGPDSEGDMLPLTRIQDAILSDMAGELAEKARQIHLI